METMWLKDSLFAGNTANAFKLGTVLSLGWFWVRGSGCSVLYRGLSLEAVDFEDVLAVAALDAVTIDAPDYIGHDPNTIYFYVVRRANGCGKLERTLGAAVRVVIDANGDLAESQASGVFEATIEQVADSKAMLLWYYCPLGQEAVASSFNVYCDNGTGQIDYQNAIATVSYSGRGIYRYQSSVLGGDAYLFAVRAVDAGAAEEIGFGQLAIEIDAGSPDAVDVLSSELV